MSATGGRGQAIQKRVFVSGRVQGVGYRASTAREAAKYAGLRGWVRNLADGRVEAVFSGDEGVVHAMVQWCRFGPPTARVSAMEVIDEAVDPALPHFRVTV